MILEGCQGKKEPRIGEIPCPKCGNPVEFIGDEISVLCEKCGATVYSDLARCAYRCPKARQCIGEEAYARLMAARRQWEEQARQAQDDDAW